MIPKAKEAPMPSQRGPRWFRSEGGPQSHDMGASLIQTRRRPHAFAKGALVLPKRRRASRACAWGLG